MGWMLLIVIPFVVQMAAIYFATKVLLAFGREQLQERYPQAYVRLLIGSAKIGAALSLALGAILFMRFSTWDDFVAEPGLYLLTTIILFSCALGGGLFGALAGMIIGRARGLTKK